MRVSRFGAAFAVVAVALAGCGGDSEKDSKAKSGSSSSAETVPAGTATAGQTAPDQAETAGRTSTDGRGGAKSPEEQPGGAGDEVPNSVQALISGRNGKLSPRTVSAPPYIAINLELRSTDGLDYALSGGGKSLHAGEGENSASATFDGLRPGKSLKLSGPQGTVTISANAEPGP